MHCAICPGRPRSTSRTIAAIRVTTAVAVQDQTAGSGVGGASRRRTISGTVVSGAAAPAIVVVGLGSAATLVTGAS